ncbi:MAG TPA: HIT domain-containing protein [Candidatus Saccharimonadales bacterium]|nr:HIT domain-containing protein [Candidatus Saccharimonadales bacterium]
MAKPICSFCNPNDRVLQENEHAILILSNPRKVPGHVLVLPKRHIEEPWQLTADELADVFQLIFFAEQRVLGELGTGVDIRQNYRPFKKEDELKKNHVLFHVIPRSKDDYLYTVSEKFEQDLFADLDDLERGEVEKLLQ